MAELGWPEPELIGSALQTGYGLPDTHLARLPIGQNTTNYQATTGARRVFVKNYPRGTDLIAEATAISLSGLAGEHGVPVAAVIRSRAGETIHRFGSGHAISLWQWIQAQPLTQHLTQHQAVEAGRTLGTLHRIFRTLPASERRCVKAERWLDPDLAHIEATIESLLAVIGRQEQPDEFEKSAIQALTERRAMLPTVRTLLAGLPDLSCQILHGDYSPANLLFADERLAAVVDFGPPEPFLLAYELGRIAFDPRSVTTDKDWIGAGITLVRAYLETNPSVTDEDVVGCARVALIQLVTSLYGIRQHHLTPGLLQADLDQFWIVRHHAAHRLLRNLDAVEAALITITQSTAR